MNNGHHVRALINEIQITKMGAAAFLILSIAACSGGGGGENPPVVPDVENVSNPGQAPLSDAGLTATYNGGEIAMLDGTGSSDPDGDPLRYTWIQVGGNNKVLLSDVHAAQPLFAVPNATDTLTFALVVNDGYDDSSAATVTVDTVPYTGTRAPAFDANPFRGRLSFSGASADMTADGNLVYIPAGLDGFYIVDASDPTHLVQVGHAGYDEARDVIKLGNFILHNGYDSWDEITYVRATDVSDPANPSLPASLGSCPSSGMGRIDLAGNMLYIASGSLCAFEITDTADPAGTAVAKASIALPAQARDVDVAGGYAFVAAGSTGLRIIDISKATAATPTLQEVASYPTTYARAVAVSGTYAYVGDSTDGLLVLDVADPTQPVKVAAIASPSDWEFTDGLSSVAITGDGKLLFSVDASVWVYDISAPGSPVPLGQYRANGVVRNAQVFGSYLYITDTKGLRSIPVTSISQPRGPALYTAPDTIRKVKLYGDLGFVKMDRQVDILDMRDPASPTVLSSYTTDSFLSDMATIGNFVYLTDLTSDKLELLRFRDPSAPDIAKTFDVDSPSEIVSAGKRAYLYRNGLDTAEVQIFDVADPYSPLKLGTLGSPDGQNNWLRTLAVEDERLYMTEFNTQGAFRVADVSNPKTPLLFGDGLYPVDLYGIAFHDGYVFSIGNNTGVKVLDVTDPALPHFVGAGYPQQGYSIAIAGNRAYVGSDVVGGGVKFLDVEDPLAPALAGELTPSGGVESPRLAGDWMYTTFHDLELHGHEREPLLAQRHVNALVGQTLDYSVSWFDEAGGDDHQVKCRVTGGSCIVGTIEHGLNSATLSWVLPVAPGDYEMTIAVGNGHYFNTTRERVRVQ